MSEVVNGLLTDCPYCGCAPGEPHGPSRTGITKPPPALLYPNDCDPED